MRGRRRAVVAAALAAGLSSALPAVPRAADPPDVGPDLYTTTVSVERRENVGPALARAMRRVLVKITGLRRPETKPGVTEALARPDSFVQRYFFDPAAEGQLIVRIDPGTLDALIERLDLGRWSRVRPRLLVWLAVEDTRGRKSYVESGSRPADALETVAAERGVPVALPLLDSEDRIALPIAALWGGFSETIRDASERYAPDSILAGRAIPVGDGAWEARWRHLGETARDRDFRTEGESLEAVVATALHVVADRFAARFARRGSAATAAAVEVTVAGVETLDDYARTLHYLSSLDIVEAVQVRRVDGSRVWFTLRARGASAALDELFALGRTLAVPPASEAGASREGPAGEYRLR